ncbi:nicotinate-nucleotide--dimethylbenzimidazole phosphoribosyltransferase [Streptomyces echinatus]|uniref:Nicotinate-nucleotide--dimethylbenzimidazole phosphoribosyltransferase n=1 Tax=Streptomyces echinatus TaxID=67293 RepID=A0A7W9PZ39_9ACTN|nr:nicotinate-nucleotide--dimethylbenzimidazole phosphoribosyltransferase [Streptomyces echinatus]MBB5930605.1 nicotinate-nucleotide--dimethylbenzimidazole phosphoribosyltransferase [Streptomyces echinatus]
MTDTGQVPGEGQPESAGMVEQPGVPAHGAYTYLSEAPAEDEDLLLPGAQGAWGNEVPPPAPEPVVEAVHEPGPHETSGRDSGSVDLSGVRLPDPGPASVTPSPILSAPHDPAAAQQQARRPLHLGPPIPNAAASPVRSLADRGPAGAPVRQPGPTATGPEYLDAQPLREMAPQNAAPWGAAPAAPAQVGSPAPAAETVDPPVAAEPADAAQAAMARLAHQVAVQTAPGDTGHVPVVHAHDGMQPLHGHDGVYTAPTGPGTEGLPAAGAQGADNGQVPGVPDGAAAEGAPVPADRAAEGMPAADGAQAAVAAAEVTAGDGGAVDGAGADGGVPVAEVPPAGETVATGAVAAPEGTEPGPAPAEAARAAEVPGDAQDPALAQGTVAAAGQGPDADVAQGPDPVEQGVLEQAAPGQAVPDPAAAHQTAPDQTAPDQTPDAGQAAQAAEPAGVVATPGGAPGVAEETVVAQTPVVEPAVAEAEVVGAEVVGAAEAGAAQPLPAAAPESVEGVRPDAAAQAAEAAQLADAAQPADATQGAETAPADASAQAAAPVAAQGAVAPSDPTAVQDPAPAADPALAEAQAGPVAEPVVPQNAAETADAGVPAPAEAAAEAAAGAGVPDPAVAGVQAVADAAVVAAEAAAAQPGPAAPAADDAVPAAQQAAGQAQEPGAATPEAPQPQLRTAAAEAPEAGTVGAAEAPQTESAVAAAQDAVPAPSAGDAAEAGQASEPAVLQVQGPQIAENAAHDAGVPATPVVARQPQAADPGDPGAAQPAGPAQAAAAAPPADPAPAPAAAGAQLPPQMPDGALPDPSAAPHTQHVVPPAQHPDQLLLSGLPGESHPEQPLGQFVPVEGQVPTTPHLAPTPPHPLVLPVEAHTAQGPQEQPEPVATVPAPREGEPAVAPAVPDAEPGPDVVQHAEDLQTRAADQEEGTAEVAEPRQSTGPAAPGYADAEREAVLKVMRERRDIRNGFRSDPIPHEVLLRVLEAAHTAPSVGHSQPWDFVVIRSAETRRTMHELAMRQREAYAKSLPKGRAKQFKELKIEAILDTPVNIVVTADPTRGGRHTLGRHTQPQMAPYSSALAVENLWLAARAEGLGVGWVSFFDEREMVRTLGLPEHLEVVAYLCVGYVDEFPDEPELMQAGWSKRRPLSWVVHEETYGRRALPGEEPHDLLAETVAQIRPLDAKALGEAWERQKRMTKPAGALGMLEIISAQLSGLSRQCPPPIPEPAAVAIFAGDHGVHAQGVTPWPQEVTAQMVANFLGGGAVCNAFANQVGAEVCVVDVGVVADLPATPGLLPRKIRGGTSDMTTGPAMTREEAKAAIEVGIETARDLVAAGNKALLTGEMGIANTTASAALISVFTGADPAEVTGRGTGINDETLARKTEVVRRALELHQPDPADPIGVLAALGGFEHAAMVGLLLGGASLRTPVILDGVSAGAAALVARAIAPEVLAACIAGHRSAEPGHVAALNKLGLRPLVDLDLRLGEGTGALLALPLVQSAARAMHEVATFDSAGVTEK